MSYGGALRWYFVLSIVACIVIYAFAAIDHNVAPEVGAVMISVAVFFGARKFATGAPLLQLSDDETKVVERRKLGLDASFGIAGTLVNGFSNLIFFVIN